MKETFNRLEPREKKLLLLLGLMIISYLLYTFAFAPALDKLNQVQSEIEALEQREAALTKEIADFNTLKSDYGSHNMDQLLAKLPDQGKVHDIILWIEDIFSDPALSKPNINFSLDNNQKQSYMQISLSFNGPYAHIYRLMDKIEDSLRLTTIESVNLSGSQNNLNANLTIRVYGQDFKEVPQGEYNFSNPRLFGGQ